MLFDVDHADEVGEFCGRFGSKLIASGRPELAGEVALTGLGVGIPVVGARVDARRRGGVDAVAGIAERRSDGVAQAFLDSDDGVGVVEQCGGGLRTAQRPSAQPGRQQCLSVGRRDGAIPVRAQLLKCLLPQAQIGPGQPHSH